MMSRSALGALAIVLGFAAPAGAAPPVNDARSAPLAINAPAVVSGTTAESTLEPDEPPGCQPLRGSVFYELQVAARDRLVARLDASGDLDATVEVFTRTRSQLAPVACESTDAQGDAALDFVAEKGQIYLIRVGQRVNSQPGSFRLEVFAPEPPPRGPGRALPAGGAGGVLDSLAHTSDAFAFRMSAGTTYRVNVAASTCVVVRVYAPGTRDFDAVSPMTESGCDGYLIFTPSAGAGGRYSLLVQAQPRRNGEQRYHLRAARAGDDDTAPGLALPNLSTVRGSLRGSELDAVDLYHFSVPDRSALDLSLRYTGSGSAQVALLTDQGRRLGRGEDQVTRQLAPGRYFVAVQTSSGGSGRYTLRRVSRTITRTSTTIDGVRSARSAPGQAVRIAAAVDPGVSGPVTITIERFDPLAGWQFAREVRTAATVGTAQTSFTPPQEGRWRAMTRFTGTSTAAPSQSGFATLLTAPPLQ
jgi:hypothetical protein